MTTQYMTREHQIVLMPGLVAGPHTRAVQDVTISRILFHERRRATCGTCSIDAIPYAVLQTEYAGIWMVDDGSDASTREISVSCPCVGEVGQEPDEDFRLQYQLARAIGERRFGSACAHEGARHGYCPQCHRRVITR